MTLLFFLQVSLPVVRRFVSSVNEKALGSDVIRGIRPEQQLVKVFCVFLFSSGMIYLFCILEFGVVYILQLG